MFQLAQGNSAETSGGLLICLPREQAAAYCKDIQKVEGYQAWIIGIVEKGQRWKYGLRLNIQVCFLGPPVSLTNLGSLRSLRKRRKESCGKLSLCEQLG